MPITRRRFCCLALVFGLLLLPNKDLRAQGEENQRLFFYGITLRGAQTSLTENWATLEFTLGNPFPAAREARVLVAYSDQPDVQYGRNVWLPAHSMLATWMRIGPAPEGNSPSRELQILLYDTTGGQERLVLRPGREHIRDRLLPYKRGRALTSIMMDLGSANLGDVARRLDEEGEEILNVVRLFRANCNLTPHVGIIQDNFLLPTSDALDGVDQFVLATARLANDPPGLMALRHWLEQGGKLWVMLDLADADALARLLGEDSGFQVVDRTSLTTVRIDGQAQGPAGEEAAVQEFEQPVKFVRVLVGPKYQVLHTVNGWPALSVRSVGRGKLVVTTLGARGWSRPRTEADPRSPYVDLPDLPLALPAMDALTQELHPLTELNPFPKDVFEPLVMDKIGYSVIGVWTAGLIFGGFLLALLTMAVVLQKSGRSELLGWLGPVLAVAAGGVFLVLGEASRRAVPPTLAVAQMIYVDPGAEEQPVSGVFAVYRPQEGTLPISTREGGLLDLDMSGLGGHSRQLVMTDLDAWHWENLSLPAGVRQGTFRCTTRTEKPVSAVATLGPEGVEGRLTAGPFRGLTDALIQTPRHQALALEIRADGTFTVGDENLLAPGQYLSGTVLTDEQQRRQAVYQRLFTETKAGHAEDRSILMAWADPVDMPFAFEPGIRMAGSALLSMPLELARTSPDTRVTIPRAFITLRRMIQGMPSTPTMEGQYPIEQQLRFQLPPSVLPMKVERARLFAKVNAPLRRFTVAGHGDSGPVQLRSKVSPIDPIEVPIDQEDFLRLDKQGGLHLDITVSDPLEKGEESARGWRIELLELEVVGRTLPEK